MESIEEKTLSVNISGRPGAVKTNVRSTVTPGALPSLTIPLEASVERNVPAAASGAGSGAILTGNSEVAGKYHLPQVWAEFLSPFEWDWFITIAPEGMPHPESLDKLFDLEVHRLNREIYGQHYWKDKRKGVFWAKATEYQQRGCPHHHALIGGIPDYVSRVSHRNWLYDHSTLSKIEPYESGRGAEYYLSKSSYAWKRGEIDCSKTLVYEKEGKRICGKWLHESFCARYASLTKPDYSQFVW